jgi:hypothetical protein
MKNYSIKDIAEKYIGQTEVKNNMGFENPDFEEKMSVIGWRPSYQWCALFSELVWFEAFQGNEEMLKIIKKNCSAGAVKTFENFHKIGMTSEIPTVGAIVIWQSHKKGLPQWTGHAGIVTKVNKENFVSIEGNTNDNGSREGIMVAEKTRKYSKSVYNGLGVLGFINPPSTSGSTSKTEKPFKNKKEGDKFRLWVNENYPAYASEIDLDKSGSFSNKYILKAFEKYGVDYKK